MIYDPNSLSPLKFELDDMVSPMTPMTPMTLERRSDDGAGPFNFQPTAMAKSPVIKSVRNYPGLCMAGPSMRATVALTGVRTWAKDVDTSTNIAASLIRSSSNHPRGRRSPCPTRFLFPPFPNAGPA